MNRPFENLAPAERQALAAEANKKARQALGQGDPRSARRYAEQAVRLAPELEDGWLLMAATASPRASITYLQHALRANPASQRAQKGMQWAVERLKAEKSGRKAAPLISSRPAAARTLPTTPLPKPETAASLITAVSVVPAAPAAPAQQHKAVPTRPAKPRRSRRGISFLLLYGLVTLCLSSAFLAGSLAPYYSQIAEPLVQGFLPYAPVNIQATYLPPTQIYPTSELLPELQPSIPPTSEATSTATESPTTTPPSTATPTPVLTETPTPTATASDTPSPTPTFTASPSPVPPTLTASPTVAPAPTQPPPTAAPQPTKKVKLKNTAAPSQRPVSVKLSDHWVDVDLSAQTVFAMQGDQIMRSFIVSTGRWPTVTVTGVFRIYVKYRTADMKGDDYYLPDVPYVMYFHEGYGLHGTYWHNNFGTPMSHGCVNLRTADAMWLYEFSSVGTVVSVHQ